MSDTIAIQVTDVDEARELFASALINLRGVYRDHRHATQALRTVKGEAGATERSARADAFGCLIVEGNKTLLAGADGSRIPMSAPERDAWVAERVKAAVADASAVVDAAQAAVDEKAEALTLAERTFTQAKADLAAAVAVLDAMAGKDRS